MKQIPLTRGLVAIVDDEDFQWLSQWTWQADQRATNRTFYARRSDNVRMHRLILGAKPGQLIEHVNGNGLDNQKKNLRLCSSSQNLMNRNVGRNNKSGFKGVYWHKKNRVFCACIAMDRTTVHLGCFDSVEQAAKAYDEAAIRYYGKFARTNFHIPGVQCLRDQPPKFSHVATKARVLNGEKSPQAKLSHRQVRAIRYAFKSASTYSLAEMFNVNRKTISLIRNNRTWRPLNERAARHSAGGG